MTLFLLAAVPLAAVILHLWFFRDRDPWADPREWIRGTVWALTALIAASFVGRWRDFGGHLGAAFAGLTVTDAVLVPGLVLGAWVLTRPRGEVWELTLWLALTFSLAGLRDTLTARPSYDLTEYLLIPLDRLLVLVVAPGLTLRLQAASSLVGRVAAGTALGALLLTAPAVTTLSWGGWGWVAWLGLGLGLAAALAAKKTPLPRKDAASGSAGPA